MDQNASVERTPEEVLLDKLADAEYPGANVQFSNAEMKQLGVIFEDNMPLEEVEASSIDIFADPDLDYQDDDVEYEEGETE